MWVHFTFLEEVHVTYAVLTMCRDAVCGNSDRQRVRRDERARFTVHKRMALGVDMFIVLRK